VPHPPPQLQDALHELSRITLRDHSLLDVLGRVATLAKTTVPGAAEVSVTLVERGTPSTIASTGQLAVDLDERQYERGRGPCLSSVADGDLVLIPKMAGEPRWADWSAEAAGRGVASSLSVPILLERETGAAMNLYATTERAFDDASVELARSLADYAGVVLANVHLYEAKARIAEQLQEAMRSRAVIDQAKGILMGARRLSSEEAFAVLTDLSMRSNRKLRDVAADLVARAAAPSDGA
jgi:GAF domain-containing protein